MNREIVERLYIITGDEEKIQKAVESKYGQYKLKDLNDFMSEFNQERVYLIPGKTNTLLKVLMTDSDSVIQLAGNYQEIKNIETTIKDETKIKLEEIFI